MVCSECYQTPCSAGYPNAPDYKPDCFCARCEEWFYPEEIADGICKECVGRAFDWETGAVFAEEHISEFLKFYLGVSCWDSPEKIDFQKRDILDGHYCHDYPRQREDLALLRDFCLDSAGRNDWITFIKKRMD